MGCVNNASGYGEGARSYVSALAQVGLDLTVQEISFESSKTNFGTQGRLIGRLIDRKIPYNAKLIILTPEHFPVQKEKNKYNIGLFYWETNKLPETWVKDCNGMNEIWVATNYIKESCLRSGVTVPIFVFGQPISGDEYKTAVDFNITPNLPSNLFKFCSVFQWTERKNPAGLLKAYFTEFKKEDKVILVLKTYGSNTSKLEQGKIKNQIAEIKKDLNLPYYPPILFLGELLTKPQLVWLYKNTDILVLPARCEGVGLPLMEAGLCGKTVITSNYGGALDFVSDETGYLINCGETPVFGMSWIKWYNGGMLWGAPDVVHLKTLMRYAYEHPEENKVKGAKLQTTLEAKFSHQVIGEQMKARLEKINA